MSPLTLLLPFAFFFQQAPTYTVAGTLVNSVTGQPLPAAHVQLGIRWRRLRPWTGASGSPM
jgi:hypothetical protein